MDLVSRARKIIMTPQAEWPVIEAEATTTAGLYTGYVMPLAAIGPVAGALGMWLFGVRVLGTSIRWPLSYAVRYAVLSYASALVGTYVLALVIDALAPTFGGRKDPTRALQLAVYSSTPAWLAGIFAVVPLLGFLGIVGLYGLYLLFLGLPVLMKAPKDKATGYTVVVVVAAVLAYMVLGAVTGAIAGTSAFGPFTG